MLRQGDKLFGTSGIREVVDEQFIELVYKVGAAVGRRYRNVLLGRDPRNTGILLRNVFYHGLLSSGAQALDCGIVPTPTLAISGEDYSASVMITASHNPPEYNGIKLFNPDGSAFSLEQQKDIENAVKVTLSNNKNNRHEDTAIEEYSGAIEKHIEIIQKQVNLKKKIKVVLDCASGAGSVITPKLLKAIGCEVITLNDEADGVFRRGIEPKESNLLQLIDKVKNTDADIGIAHDGDADRMMAVCEDGQYVEGDLLFCILAKHEKAKNVVTTIDASMAIEECFKNVRRTPVGDGFISQELKTNGGDFGGEASGSWIFPKNSYCPDGILAAAKMAEVASGMKLSEALLEVKKYPVIRSSINLASILDFDMGKVEKHLEQLKPINIDKTDGCKLFFNNGWLLLRKSGTEPKMRLTIEAKTHASAKEMYDKSVAIIEKAVGVGAEI